MRVLKSTTAWTDRAARAVMLALIGTAIVAIPLLHDTAPANAQSRDGFGRVPYERPSTLRGSESGDRRVASEADFLVIAAQGDLARGDTDEARRKLDTVVSRFPSEPAASEAQRLLQHLAAGLSGGPTREPPAVTPVPGLERTQRPPPSLDRSAAIVGRRLAGLHQDFRVAIGDRVFFGEAGIDIGSKSRSVLAAQAEWLKRHSSLLVTIEGHADDRGSATFNRDLAERRADAVRARLVEEGVSPDRIRILSLGREQQVAPCNDVGCAAQNRRVVTVITDRSSLPNEVHRPDAPQTGYTRTRGN